MYLTDRQTRFVDEYLIDLNGTQAALRAGYSPSGARQEGSRLLTNADIKALVARKQAQTAQRLEITREDVIRGLVSAITLAKEQSNPMAMIRACREIGLMLGYYRQMGAPNGVPADDRAMLRRFEAMTDEELLGIVEGGFISSCGYGDLRG